MNATLVRKALRRIRIGYLLLAASGWFTLAVVTFLNRYAVSGR